MLLKIKQEREKMKKTFVEIVKDLSELSKKANPRMMLQIHFGDESIEIILNPYGRSKKVSADLLSEIIRYFELLRDHSIFEPWGSLGNFTVKAEINECELTITVAYLRLIVKHREWVKILKNAGKPTDVLAYYTDDEFLKIG